MKKKDFAGASPREERREKLSRMRRTVATNLKDSQNINVSTTTFQEIDMSAVMNMRKELGAEFLKEKGLKLGFMSFFIKAATRALVERPVANAVIDTETNEVIYKNYVDMSVAVSSPRGLVTPVLRNLQTKSFTDVEGVFLNLFKNYIDDG